MKGAAPELSTRNEMFHPPKRRRGSICSDMRNKARPQLHVKPIPDYKAREREPGGRRVTWGERKHGT